MICILQVSLSYMCSCMSFSRTLYRVLSSSGGRGGGGEKIGMLKERIAIKQTGRVYYGTQLSSLSRTPLNVSDTNSGPLPATPTLTQCVFGRAHDLIPSLAISTVIIGWILANFTHRCSFWNSSNAIHNLQLQPQGQTEIEPGWQETSPPPLPPPLPNPPRKLLWGPAVWFQSRKAGPGGQRSRPYVMCVI